MKTRLHIQPTSSDDAEMIASELDFATTETERITQTHAVDSLRGSLTVWDGDTPLCSYGIVPPQDGGSAHAWMMVTNYARGRGRARDVIELMRGALGDSVRLYGRVEGYTLIGGDAPRMLSLLGATFMLANHPSFLRWELHDNPQLRRDS